jgi:hypothetical protein
VACRADPRLTEAGHGADRGCINVITP